MRWLTAVLAAATVGLATLAGVPASASGAKAAADPWLDASFGNQGRVTQDYVGNLGTRVVDLARAPNGDVVLALEPAHVTWGCCASDVGAWALARLAPDGTPRDDFGDHGVIHPALDAPRGSRESVTPLAMEVDGQGRILLLGYVRTGGDVQSVLMRLTSSGAADPSFSGDGWRPLPSPAACGADLAYYSDAILQGGSVVAVGSCSTFDGFRIVAARVLGSGALDDGFGNAGVRSVLMPESVGACCTVTIEATTGGKFLVGTGSHVGALLRLLDDGALDVSWGGDGIVTLPGNGASLLLPLGDGRVIVSTQNANVVRLSEAGVVDQAYGEPGFDLPDPCFYPTLLDLGGSATRTVGAVHCQQGVWLSALDGDGALDTTYGLRASSIRSYDSVQFSAPGRHLLADGTGMLVAGSRIGRGFVIERRGATGAIDGSYGTNGLRDLTVTGRWFGLESADGAYDSEDRLVTVAAVEGRSMADEMAVVVSRLLPDGSPDPTFGVGGSRVVEAGGWTTGEEEGIEDPQVLIAPDDSVVVVAAWRDESFSAALRNALFYTRLTPSGQVDTATVPTGRRLVQVPDMGEAWLGGAVAGQGGTALVSVGRYLDDGEHPALVRLQPSGAIDTSYGVNGLATAPEVGRSGEPGLDLASLPGGGALMVWREWSNDFDRDALMVARVTSDGDLDPTYGTNGRYRMLLPGRAHVAATSSGRALIGWSVPVDDQDTFSLAATIRVRGLSAQGALDPTFGNAGDVSLPPPNGSTRDAVLDLAAAGERPVLLLVRRRTGAERLLLTRLQDAGSVDADFGSSGSVALSSSQQIAGGLRYELLATASGPITLVQVPYRGSSVPDVVEATRVRARVPRLDAPTSVVLAGKATWGWGSAGLLAPATVQRSLAGSKGGFGAWSTTSSTTPTTARLTLKAGTTTCVRVRGSDGELSLPACAASPVKATTMSAKGGWSPLRATKYYRSQARTSARKGATLSLRVTARSLAVVASRCPGCGSVIVRWNGKTIGRLSLAGPRKSRVVLPVRTTADTRSGKVTLGVASSGKPVTIEGLATWRDDTP